MSKHERHQLPTKAETIEVASALAETLPESLKYAIVGGAACTLLGSKRQTMDVDFVVPRNCTAQARSALKASPRFQVQPRTNHTTYEFEASDVQPIDIEILAPPSLFQEEYNDQSPVVQVEGGVRVLHPAIILASKCKSVTGRSSLEKRASDAQDIAFLLKYLFEHEQYRTAVDLERVRAVAPHEWIAAYLEDQPMTKEWWVALGLYHV
jgi:hypothetical protein